MDDLWAQGMSRLAMFDHRVIGEKDSTDSNISTWNDNACHIQHADITLPLARYLLLITLWLFNIAMENGPFIDDFPIKNLHL